MILLLAAQMRESPELSVVAEICRHYPHIVFHPRTGCLKLFNGLGSECRVGERVVKSPLAEDRDASGIYFLMLSIHEATVTDS